MARAQCEWLHSGHSYSHLIGVLLFLLAVLVPSPTWSQASREKCTCDLGAPDRGSIVANATLCVRHRPRAQWCDVYVKYLEGESSQVREFVLSIQADYARLGSDATGGQYIAQLQEEIGRLLNEYASSQPDIEYLRDDVSDIVSNIIPEQAPNIAACVDKFIAGARRFALETGTGFDCVVGEESGWLNLRFTVRGQAYNILVSPSS